MKASEMRDRLDALIALHGDQEMLVDSGVALETIEEIDLDVDDNGFVIWMGAEVKGKSEKKATINGKEVNVFCGCDEEFDMNFCTSSLIPAENEFGKICPECEYFFWVHREDI